MSFCHYSTSSTRTYIWAYMSRALPCTLFLQNSVKNPLTWTGSTPNPLRLPFSSDPGSASDLYSYVGPMHRAILLHRTILFSCYTGGFLWHVAVASAQCQELVAPLSSDLLWPYGRCWQVVTHDWWPCMAADARWPWQWSHSFTDVSYFHFQKLFTQVWIKHAEPLLWWAS